MLALTGSISYMFSSAEPEIMTIGLYIQTVVISSSADDGNISMPRVSGFTFFGGVVLLMNE